MCWRRKENLWARLYSTMLKFLFSWCSWLVVTFFIDQDEYCNVRLRAGHLGLPLEEDVPDYDLDLEDEEWLSRQTMDKVEGDEDDS